jgi:hypothetical protein
MHNKLFLTAVTLALMAGCTSKGSCSFAGCGPDAPVGSPGGTGGVEITRDNALTILREAWFAANTTSDLPFFVLATGIGDTSGGVVSVGGNNSKTLPSNRVFMTPFGPTAYNCPVSGTFIVTGDVADMNTITAGDFSTYEASACDSGTGFSVDGTHSLDIISVTGDVASGQYEVAQTMDFTSFRATSASGVATINGDHTVVLDTRIPASITTAYSGDSLDVTEQGITVLARNYSGFMTTDTGTFGTSFDVVGTVNSSVIAGSYNYSNSETIQRVLGDNPADGIFDVDGANFSTARILIVDSNALHLEVDDNGSGNYEFSIANMTWEEFLGTAP